MAQSLDLHLGFASLIPIAHANLSADDQNPTGFSPGAITMGSSRFGGLAMYRYGRTQQSGGQSKGELASRLADVTGTVTAAAGETNDTTHLADTSNFTSGNEVGKVCMITDDAGAAGAAPEGEIALIIANTASQMTFDPDYALSAAPAASDTYSNYATYHHDDAADGDLAINVLGVLMADRTAAYYGWLQFYGLNPGTLYTTNTVAKGDPVVADAAAVNAYGADTEQLWVGYAPNTIAADLASPFRSSCVFDLLHHAQPIA